jgi:PAS domain S-box-containing protein
MHIRHSFSVRLFRQSLKRIGAALTHNPAEVPPTSVETASTLSKPHSLAQSPDPAYAPLTATHPDPLDQLQRTALLTRLAVDLQAALDPATIAHSVLTAIGLHSDTRAAIVLASQGASIELAWANDGGQLQPLPPEQARQLLEYRLDGWNWRDSSSVVLTNNAQAGFEAGAGEAAPAGSLMALPLAHGQASFGLLALSHPLPGHFTSQDLLLFQSVAAQAGVALSAARYSQVARCQPDRMMPEQASQVAHSRDPMHIIFDHLPDGLVLIDAEERILIANDAFCDDVLGVLPRTVIGRPYATIIQELEQAVQISIEPQPNMLMVRRASCVGADGRKRRYEIDRYAVATGDQAEQIIERWRDITRREEQQRELLHDEQLTTMARLAANVVHEIGNPLQSVRSCIDLSREDATLAATTAEYLELASSELRRMSQILSQLRDLYRLPLNEANNE